jgi:GT2 family glycosyltransferase/glycosyltransferase involved in cell wall biosynthesis
MPTANRRRWVPQAIRYFLQQDYPNRELVILDDGDDVVEDLIPADTRIHYQRLRGSRSLGAKQNLCVSESRGDLILHWDDDDWFAPHRISYQVDELLRAGAEICGLSRMLFHDLPSGRTWLYEFAAGQECRWLAGGSLLYTREFWSRSPFPDIQIGADTAFVWSQPLDGAVALDDYEIYVAMIHGTNTSPKVGQENWTPWHGDLRRIMGDDFRFYDFARSQTPAQAALRIGYVQHRSSSGRREISALRGLGHQVFVYTPDAAVSSLAPLIDAVSGDGIQHLHGSGTQWAQSMTRLVAEALGIPFTIGIASEISLFTEDDATAFRTIAASPQCAGIAVENAFIRERLVSLCGVGRQRIIVVPASLDLGVYRLDEPRLRRAAICILTVMQVVEREALARLMAAFRELSRRRDGVELWLAGGDSDEAELRAAAAGHPSIACPGSLSAGECREVYARADIFCLPCERLPRNDGEETPMALLEAMAFELPVVTSSLLSLSHYIRDGEQGLLAPPRDSSALADRLELLCDDYDLRLAMGRRGRQRVEQLGDIATNTARLAELFGRPLASAPAADLQDYLPIHSIADTPGSAAPKTEIIVPTFGQEQYTVRCFESLLACTSSYRLVWVDNGSSAASRAIVDAAFAKHPRRLSIWSTQNLGFVGGTNAGLRAILGEHASDAEYVVLLNNDTEVTPEWLERLIGALERDPSAAAAGPMTSPLSPWQSWSNVLSVWGKEAPEALRSGTAGDGSRALAAEFGDSVVTVPMLAFFCTVFRKRVFSEVGLLDPRFGAGLGDDDDYCFRLRSAGYGLAFVPGAYVVHHHRTTFRTLYSEPEIVAMQHENYAKYRAKHGIG